MKTSLKLLIWLYVILLIGEGALRKWVFPGWSDPLLVVRDPVLLAIYILALATDEFPGNRWTVALIILAVLSTVFSFLGGHNNLVVLGYGLRVNYLHVPLIWIMGRVLNRRDVERLGAFLLIMAIPMAFIMVQQFRAPMNAVINRGVGYAEIGQIFGADGRIRPPGLFAFITGPQLFFPLCAAFFFDEISGAKRLPWYLIAACGLAITIALSISISRTVMLATVAVAVAFLCMLPFSSIRFGSLMRPVLLLALIGVGLFQLPVFRESTSVFMMRWDTAEAGTSQTSWGGLADRTARSFTNPYYYLKMAPMYGHGIGTGSNVGARLTSGEMGFLLAEEEWGKILLELGPLLGLAFILFRVALTGWLGLLAWRALRERHNLLPLLIFAAVGLTILQGQWAPPTVLGFAVVGGGLLLGALNPAPARVPAGSERAPAPTALPATAFLAPLPEPNERRLPSVLRPR